MFAPAGPAESSANAVLYPFGSPNATGVGSLCFVSYGMIAPRSVFGEVARDLADDLGGADLALVWGANPATASPPENLVRLKQLQARGGRVVVIDHRRSETVRALRADWVGIRPGTDGALALGMINVLIAEDLYDREFVARTGRTASTSSRAYAAAFTPERVETITGVPAATVVELARAIGASKATAVLMYTGLEYSNSGVQAIRAALVLQAIAGHLDVPGGKVIRMPDRTEAAPQRDAGSGRRCGPPIGAAEFPIYHEVRQEAHGGMLPKAILEGDPYPVRGMIVSGASILTAWPDPALWRRALAALDLLVVIDRFPTGDAAYADLVLPATTMFEIESYQEFDDRVELRQQILPPPGEARNDYLIFAELADRLGYGDRWPQTERGMVELALAGHRHHLRRARREPGRHRAGAAGAALPEVRDRRAARRRRARLQHAHRQARDRVGVVPQLRLRAAARLHRADRGAARRAGAGEALPAGAQLRRAHEERLPLAAPQHPVARRHAAVAARAPARRRCRERAASPTATRSTS